MENDALCALYSGLRHGPSQLRFELGGCAIAEAHVRGDVMVVNRAGQTTVDMANSPEQRTQPFPETIALLEGMGAKNNNNCRACK